MARTILALVLAVSVAGCSNGNDKPVADAEPEDPGVIHVHGLGVNEFDGALFIATHSGLFRLPSKSDRATRVGDSRQDIMGFEVIGSDRFLASGHPDARTDDPPLLGLIESGDAGKSWTSVALSGQADFHILREESGTVYAQDSHSRRLFAGAVKTTDLSLRESPPGELYDLAIRPRESASLIAATDTGLFVSRDGARNWRRLDRKRTGLLAYTPRGALVLVAADGSVERSDDHGRRWTRAGSTGSPVVALHAYGEELYAAVPDGPILQSLDAGRTWTVRLQP
jgi:hypothetical protein